VAPMPENAISPLAGVVRTSIAFPHYRLLCVLFHVEQRLASIKIPCVIPSLYVHPIPAAPGPGGTPWGRLGAKQIPYVCCEGCACIVYGRRCATRGEGLGFSLWIFYGVRL